MTNAETFAMGVIFMCAAAALHHANSERDMPIHGTAEPLETIMEMRERRASLELVELARYRTAVKTRCQELYAAERVQWCEEYWEKDRIQGPAGG